MPGMIYAQKLLVSPSMDIFKYHGIRPALKYIVTTRHLYQIFLHHISCFVTRYPTKADASTISTVPRIVLPTVTINAVPTSFTLNMDT